MIIITTGLLVATEALYSFLLNLVLNGVQSLAQARKTIKKRESIPIKIENNLKFNFDSGSEGQKIVLACLLRTVSEVSVIS